jgi:hypothetical protein
MKEVREIKKVKSKIRRASEEAKDLKSNVKLWQQMYSLKISEIQSLTDKLKEMNKGDIKITEHAILRYIERVLGINIEQIEKSILEELDLETIEKIGNGTYPVRDFNVVIKENFIITVIKNEDKGLVK